MGTKMVDSCVSLGAFPCILRDNGRSGAEKEREESSVHMPGAVLHALPCSLSLTLKHGVQCFNLCTMWDQHPRDWMCFHLAALCTLWTQTCSHVCNPRNRIAKSLGLALTTQRDPTSKSKSKQTFLRDIWGGSVWLVEYFPLGAV